MISPADQDDGSVLSGPELLSLPDMRRTSGAGILDRGAREEWLHPRIISTPAMKDLPYVEENGELFPAEVALPV
jgi:hypothetical protein